MQALEQIHAEINKLVSTCYGRSYKNRESLSQLKQAFEKLRNIRKGIILYSHNFPGDLSVAVIIEDISKLLEASRDKKLLEWTFDHYNDLFKFKAEDLQADIVKILSVNSEGKL